VPRRTWTDDELRRAIAASRTWTDVLRRLGMAGRSGGSLVAARRRADELDLDTSHLPTRDGAAPRSWTDQELERAVAAATSLAGVFRELGLQVGGGAWQRMREHIQRLELDTSHFTRGTVAAPGRREDPAWSDEDLRQALPGVRSVSEVMRRLGLSANAHRERQRIVARIEQLDLSVDGLRGRAWARGRRGGGRPARPLEDLLVAGRELGSTSGLKRRLLAESVFDPRCRGCGLEEWRGGPIPLQLDHIDGDRTNNLLSNLRLLCPNCHALTDTYCGRNIGRR
jgi:hypothetical protein